MKLMDSIKKVETSQMISEIKDTQKAFESNTEATSHQIEQLK